jgi:predicted PurR-regulated permease PerM
MSEQVKREGVANVLFYGAVLLLAWMVYRIFEPFLVPLGWATVLVVAVHPWQARFERRWSPSGAAAATTATVTLILIVPTLLLMTAFINEGIDAGRNLQASIAAGDMPWLERARAWLVKVVPAGSRMDWAGMAREGAERVASFFAARAGGLLGDVIEFFFDLFVTLFALFFFLRDRRTLLDGLRRLLPFEEQQREAMLEEAQELIHSSVTSSLVVAAVQGLLGGIAFAVLGIPGAIFWGVTMAFFALIPLVGTGIVVGPAVLWLLLSGQLVKGIILAVAGFLVIGTVDNFLRPYLVRGRSQMSALVIFISVMGGISLFGMLGLVLGPIVVATAAGIFDVYTQRGAEAAAAKTAYAAPAPALAPSPAAETASPAAPPVVHLPAAETPKTGKP